MKNELAVCTWTVPDNKFGIIAMHCRDNVPLEPEDYQKLFEGPLAASQLKLLEELAIIGDETLL